ncbi:MAG TPA: hypothetical protein PKK26_00550 [Candidatus Wallbacteria bacterium]|nr:hypothetical protein [Candidatus Wallbacteria bacterium]
MKNHFPKLAAALFLVIASTLFFVSNSHGQKTGEGGMDPAMKEFRQAQEKKTAEYLEKQDTAAQEFMKTLTGSARDEKLKAIKEFKTAHYNENCEFRDKMHAETLDFVKKRMEARKSMPEAMKNKMIARLESEYEEFKKFHEKKNAENMEFLDKLIADKTKDGTELETILKDFFKSQKDDAKEFLNKKREGAQKKEK